MNEKKLNEQNIEQAASAAKSDAGKLAEVTGNELDQVEGGSSPARRPVHPYHDPNFIGGRSFS